MSFLKTVSPWKLALLLISLLLAPHSLNNSYSQALLQINGDFYFSMFLMSITLFLCWYLLHYYLKSDGTWLYRSICALKKFIFSPHHGRILLLCSLFVLLSVYLVSFLVYDFVPRVADEIDQLFQSKIFLSGHLTAPSPPFPEFFAYAEDNMIVSPKWYCQYPPGFSFLLTLGLWLGSPWLVNSLLAAVSVVLIYLLCRELFDGNTAILSALLFSLSPKVIFTSASLMNHTAAMFFMLLSITTLLISMRRHSALLALCAGLSIGACLNIRTLDAIVLSIPIGIYILVTCVTRRSGFRVLGMWLCGFCIMAGILLFYNYQTNGDPLLFGYTVRWGGSHQLGFNEVRGFKMHATCDGLRNIILLNKLNDKALFEWPVPASFFILLLFVFARKTFWDFFLLSIIILNLTIYFFWGWSDYLFMGRFYFVSLPYFIILVARGIQCLGALCSGNRDTEIIEPSFAKPAPALLIAIVMLLFAGFTRISDIVPQYYPAILQVDRRIEHVVEKTKIKNAIVFIEPQDKYELIVGSGFFMNTPDLAAQDIIFAKDLGDQNKRLLQAYPGRKGYLYRHRRDVKKVFLENTCISPSEAFELVPIEN